MKTIYLHIGIHKTGTTAIQKYLFNNSRAIKEKGFDYLSGNCVWSAHHPLGWMFQGAQKAVYEYCNWHDFGVINNIEYEIENSTCDNFIISSENLYFTNNHKFIRRFFERFKSYNIKVIVYLRNQASFIESWYYELVRADYKKLTTPLC